MPVGLQVFDANGQLRLDTNTRVFFWKGILQIPGTTTSGSFTIGTIPAGTVFHYAHRIQVQRTVGNFSIPLVTYNASTGVVSYSFPQNYAVAFPSSNSIPTRFDLLWGYY